MGSPRRRQQLAMQQADKVARRARIKAILASVPDRPYPTMAELDASEYDDEGRCR